MPIDTSWLKIHFAESGLSGWGAVYGLSWNALSLYIFTPWIGFGVEYASPHPMYQPPAVATGYFLGWGRNKPEDGGFRYRHSDEHRRIRYSEEWAASCR